jgi:hypothetical protein
LKEPLENDKKKLKYIRIQEQCKELNFVPIRWSYLLLGLGLHHVGHSRLLLLLWSWRSRSNFSDSKHVLHLLCRQILGTAENIAFRNSFTTELMDLDRFKLGEYMIKIYKLKSKPE